MPSVCGEGENMKVLEDVPPTATQFLPFSGLGGHPTRRGGRGHTETARQLPHRKMEVAIL